MIKHFSISDDGICDSSPVKGNCFSVSSTESETSPTTSECFSVSSTSPECFRINYKCDTSNDTPIPNTLDLSDFSPYIRGVYGVWFDIDGSNMCYAAVHKDFSAYIISFKYYPSFGVTSEDYWVLSTVPKTKQNLNGNGLNLSGRYLNPSASVYTPDIYIYEVWPVFEYHGVLSIWSYGDFGYWDKKWILPQRPQTYEVGTINGDQHCGQGFIGQPILKTKAFTTFGDGITLKETDEYANSEWGTGCKHKQGEWYVFANTAVKNPILGYYTVNNNCYYGYFGGDITITLTNIYGDIQFSNEIMMHRRYDIDVYRNRNYSIEFYDLLTGLLITNASSMSDATLVGGRMVMYGTPFSPTLKVVSVDTL